MVCRLSCCDAASLRLHNESTRHKKKVERGDADFECTACNVSFRYLSNFYEGRVVFLHLPRAGIKAPSSLSFYFLLLPSSTERRPLVIQPCCCNQKDFKMASDLTFPEGVAVAMLIFTILAVLFTLPHLLVPSCGLWFFPTLIMAYSPGVSSPQSHDILPGLVMAPVSPTPRTRMGFFFLLLELSDRNTI
jgi:hypothetical protein